MGKCTAAENRRANAISGIVAYQAADRARPAGQSLDSSVQQTRRPSNAGHERQKVRKRRRRPQREVPRQPDHEQRRPSWGTTPLIK